MAILHWKQWVAMWWRDNMVSSLICRDMLLSMIRKNVGLLALLIYVELGSWSVGMCDC